MKFEEYVESGKYLYQAYDRDGKTALLGDMTKDELIANLMQLFDERDRLIEALEDLPYFKEKAVWK
jgi:hypothetical protein